MYKTLRTIVVSLLVVGMSFNPAMAWHCFRGYGHYYHSYAPIYYSSGYYGGGYYGCGGYWGGRYVGGCCRHETVVYETSCCGGCVSCCGCGSCDGGGVVEGTPTEDIHQPTLEAPAEAIPPAHAQPMPTPPTQKPATVNKPMETTPAPQFLPPEPAPDLVEPVPSPPEPAPSTPEPAPAESADDLFGPTSTEPAETPPPAESAEPTESTDDLFGPTSDSEAAPAEGAATPPATEPSTSESSTSEPAADDLFGEPADAGSTEGTATPAEGEATPAEDTSTPAESGTEETPSETPAEEAAPAEGAAPAEESSDDIFGPSSAVLREPGGLASEETRLWVDNTGRFSCRGRLVRFLDGQVRLLKDNGRTTTVPLYRLSTNDLAFVHRQASAQQAEVFGQTAQSLSTLPWLAN